MDLKNIKEMLRDKKARRKIVPKLIASILAVICVITLAGGIVLNNKLRKEEDRKNISTSTNKENKEVVVNNEEEAKKELEELKKTDTSKLSDEEKKQAEEKIKSIENMIENKEYEKVKQEVEVVKKIVTPTVKEKIDETTTTSSSSKEGNTSSSSSSSSSSGTSEVNKHSEKPSEPVKKHTHKWVDITEEIHHPEEGHWEEVVITPEQVKEVPVYESQPRAICNGCGKDITDDIDGHMRTQMLAGNMACSGYTVIYKDVQVGTKQEVIPAVTEQKWIVDKAAWTETKVVGRKCVDCGANE